MGFWLVKSEPEDWSWHQQLDCITEPWDGVRNHQAAGFMRRMQSGDKAFFYHSGKERAIVGIVTVATDPYPDPADISGKFVLVDMAADRALPVPVLLKDIKADPAFSGFSLVRQSRLSVMPVEDEYWQKICTMGGL